VLETFLILAVGWLVVALIDISLGRVAARADRKTERALHSAGEVATARVVAVSPLRSAPSRAVRHSRVRIGPA